MVLHWCVMVAVGCPPAGSKASRGDPTRKPFDKIELSLLRARFFATRLLLGVGRGKGVVDWFYGRGRDRKVGLEIGFFDLWTQNPLNILIPTQHLFFVSKNAIGCGVCKC